MTGAKVGRDVAEAMLNEIYTDLGIDQSVELEDDALDVSKRLIKAIMAGRLEYDDNVFKLSLLSPIMAGDKEVSVLEIGEPSGADLREMASVKNKNDDVGKAMAVLASVTGLGLPVINRLKSRDMMTAVAVMSLFL